eukprot:g30721.t1
MGEMKFESHGNGVGEVWLTLGSFGFQARDYFSWSAELLREMKVEEATRDSSMTDLKRTQHQQLRAEIDAREETFEQVMALGQEILRESFPSQD